MDLETLVNILVISYIIPQLFMAIYLLSRMKSKNLPNLLWISLFFLGNAMEIVIQFLYLPIVWLTMIIYLSNISLAFYAKFTFQKNENKNTFIIIILILIILKLITFTINGFFYKTYNVFEEKNPLPVSEYFIYYLIRTLTSSLVAISYLYPAILSLRYYRSIRETSIEPWIKKRYQILGISFCFPAVNSVLYFFLPITGESAFQSPLFAIVAILLLMTNIIFTIGNVIGWFMPNKLKTYFNRKYINPFTGVEDLSDEEIMNQLRNGDK